jgi:hypothetical protein
MGIIETSTIDIGPRLRGNNTLGRDDELLDWRFWSVSWGMYLPAWVLLRGGGLGWAIFISCYTMYDIYIYNNTRLLLLQQIRHLLVQKIGMQLRHDAWQ